MQPTYIEKLQQDLAQNHTSVKGRVDLLNELAFITRGYGILEERTYAEKAFHLASQIQYLPGIAQAQVHLAFNKIYFDGDFESALQLIWSARQTSLEANFNEAFVHSLVLEGLISWNLGQYERAFNLVAQALDSQYQVNQALLLAWGNYVMGSFYLELKDYEDALQYHLTALQHFEQTQDAMGHATTVSGLGIIYHALGKLDLAIDTHHQAIEMAKKHHIPSPEARALQELGAVYETMGDFDKARQYYADSLALRQAINNRQGVIASLIVLGALDSRLKAYEQALESLHKALELAEQAKAKLKMLRICHLLAQLYKECQDPWKALQYFEQYIALKEEISGEQNATQIKNIKTLFDLEKTQKEAEIERLRHVELKQAYERIESQNNSILDSLLYAKRIQEALLPSLQELAAYTEQAFVFFKPKDIVSGDFYWVYHTETILVMAAVDCTGHGVPGAFMVAMGNAFLNEIVLENNVFDPGLVLTQLDERVRKSLKQQENNKQAVQDGMDIVLITIDKTQNNLHFAGAKNPLYRVRTQQMEQFEGTKHPIGSSNFTKQKHFDTLVLDLMPGDSYYLASDGFQDQFGGKEDKKFLKKRFRELLLTMSLQPMPEQAQTLEKTFADWKGQRIQTDDVLVIGIRI